MEGVDVGKALNDLARHQMVRRISTSKAITPSSFTEKGGRIDMFTLMHQRDMLWRITWRIGKTTACISSRG